MKTEHTIEIRVRYHETDAQGHVHHANYFNYFELGRIEFLRAIGRDYLELESAGMNLVVSAISCQYMRPSRFGDTLILCTKLIVAKGARLLHEYEITRDNELIATGQSTVACVDHEGRVQRLPDWLRGKGIGKAAE